MSMNTGARITRVKKHLLRVGVIMAAMLNAVVVLPGITISIITGHYLVSVALVLFSVIVWVAGWGIANAVRAHRNRRAGEAASD